MHNILSLRVILIALRIAIITCDPEPEVTTVQSSIEETTTVKPEDLGSEKALLEVGLEKALPEVGSEKLPEVGLEKALPEVGSEKALPEVGSEKGHPVKENVTEKELIDDEELDKDESPIAIPYAYSPIHLTNLVKIEHDFYHMAKAYEKKLEERLELLKRYKQDYEETSLKTLEALSYLMTDYQKASFVSGHPFLAYRIIRRFRRNVRPLLTHLILDLEKDLFSALTTLLENVDLPNEADEIDAIASIVRLQDVYDPVMSEFTNGVFQGNPTGIGLTAQQCWEMGAVAIDNGNTIAAADWLRMAHHKSVFQRDNSISAEEIHETWQLAIERHASIWDVDKLGFTDIFKDAKKQIKRDYNRFKKNRTVENSVYNYVALCRGEDLLTSVESARLFCWFESNSHPYWIINPQKMELHSKDPYLVQIYDFVNDEELMSFSLASIPELLSASHIENDPNLTPEENRMNHIMMVTTTEMNDTTLPQSARSLTKKIEFITGLHVTKEGASQPYIVGAHAPVTASQPDMHNDALGHFSGIMGPRMATFLFFMEHQQFGGEITFPIIGKAVKAVKKSALFWYNTYKNGSVDERTSHQDCPLLLGHKWTATRWIHANENFLKRPCGRKETA